MTPHKCPVCDGSGKYRKNKCHACGASGIVWSKDDTPVKQVVEHIHRHVYEHQPYYVTSPFWSIPTTATSTDFTLTDSVTTNTVHVDLEDMLVTNGPDMGAITSS